MNIFYLDKNPYLAAQYHANIHVNKMIIETAQMLCTAHRILDKHKDHPDVLYKTTHVNHPSSIWVRDSLANYNWTVQLFLGLCDEYTYRYNKTHLTDKKLRDILSRSPENIKIAKLTQPPQCMPDEYKRENAVLGYRNYYVGEKEHMLKYTIRSEPLWLQDWLYEKHGECV